MLLTSAQLFDTVVKLKGEGIFFLQQMLYQKHILYLLFSLIKSTLLIHKFLAKPKQISQLSYKKCCSGLGFFKSLFMERNN